MSSARSSASSGAQYNEDDDDDDVNDDSDDEVGERVGATELSAESLQALFAFLNPSTPIDSDPGSIKQFFDASRNAVDINEYTETCLEVTDNDLILEVLQREGIVRVDSCLSSLQCQDCLKSVNEVKSL